MFKKKLRSSQVSRNCTWFDEENKRFDTVVFVHGILGDQISTWGIFPALLHDDQELPKLGILTWGYRSSLLPSNYQDVESESQRLFSNLTISVEDGEPIHIVAHSMGGLVTLKFLVDAIDAKREKSHPTDSISLITLYATPLQGSAWADRIIEWVNQYRVTRWLGERLPKKQLENLRSNGFVDELISEVSRLVTTVDVDSQTPGERVTVQIVTADRDSAVSRESSQGPFSDDPPALTLEGSHGSVKRPEHHGDERYDALKVNLVRKLAHRVHSLAVRWRVGEPTIDGKLAAMRVADQYEEQIELCQQACFGGRFLTPVEEDDVFSTFLDYASDGIYTPQQLMRMTIADFEIPDKFFKPGASSGG